MAVQLARVSLWLQTLSGDRPLTFLDHHLRCGDSLVGATLEELEKPVPGACLDRDAKKRNKAYGQGWRGLTELPDVRGLLERLLRHREELAGPDESVEDVRRKDRLLHEDQADEQYLRVKDCLDLRCALWFWPDAPREGGVLILGDVTKKRKYNTARSVAARKWKADSRRIREEKD